jgi:hypothetical protein
MNLVSIHKGLNSEGWSLIKSTERTALCNAGSLSIGLIGPCLRQMPLFPVQYQNIFTLTCFVKHSCDCNGFVWSASWLQANSSRPTGCDAVCRAPVLCRYKGLHKKMRSSFLWVFTPPCCSNWNGKITWTLLFVYWLSGAIVIRAHSL